jgi:cytidine deaminase
MDWRFFGVADDGGLCSLSEVQRRRVLLYEKALDEAARTDVTKPRFSSFKVRSSAGMPGYAMQPTGNREYGFCQALHAEEVGVARIVEQYGEGIPVFGLITGRVPTPCGNCRDILLDEFGALPEIVSGDLDRRIAVVTTMGAYLFDPYLLVPHDQYGHLLDAAPRVLFQGQRVDYDPYSPASVHPERKYFVELTTRHGRYYGAADVACDYHPIYPIQDAIRAARRDSVHSVNEVIVVGEGQPPHVMYRDRQHLFEYNLLDELVLGRAQDPPVYLIGVQEGKVTAIWQTSVKEWLPRPFSPASFTDMEYLAAYAKGKTQA